jgi:predicted branched-subunit amino acid permease
MNIRYKIFSKGCLDVIPLLIPVVPFGIIFGVIGIESGLGSTVTFLMSIIIFAGSSQLAFAQLFTSGATTPVIVSSVAIVNSRHFLYSAVIAQYLTKVKLFWKIILSYFLTDQAFIVSQKYFKEQPKNKDRHYHLLGSGFTLWFVWQLSTIAGIVLGEVIPKELSDIDAWVKNEVDESVTFAENSPYPEAEELYKDVYVQADYPYIKEY